MQITLSQIALTTTEHQAAIDAANAVIASGGATEQAEQAAIAAAVKDWVPQPDRKSDPVQQHLKLVA